MAPEWYVADVAGPVGYVGYAAIRQFPADLVRNAHRRPLTRALVNEPQANLARDLDQFVELGFCQGLDDELVQEAAA